MKTTCLLTTILLFGSLQAKPMNPLSKPIECQLVSSVRKGCHVPLNEMADSPNWSGYFGATNLVNPSTGSVTAVSGYWVVPTLHATKSDAFCAIWVGMDGVYNSTVEQLGTDQNWQDGAQVNSAWFEMYPAVPVTLQGFPVNNGDLIYASVTYLGSDSFELYIENLTRGVYYYAPTSLTQSSIAQRNSAEWIVEAPAIEGGTVLPLSNFGATTLYDCTAEIGGVSARITNSSWQSIPFYMHPTPGVIIQTLPASQDGANFTVTWTYN